ncbi:MAG: sulfotransferase [Acidimicrobiales bacterium]|jgi:hypothetical protein
MQLRQRTVEIAQDLPSGIHELVPASLRRSLRHRLGRYYPWELGFDHHVWPELAPGEETGPPEFVGIGVQKAGTSWWYTLIVEHPLVYAPALVHKERHFFARFGAEGFGPDQIADYHAWFPRIPGTITGEWTPDYFYYPWAPPLLAQAAPDAKLLLILRDPIQRFRSGLAHQLRDGEEHVGSAQAEALGRSFYAVALRRWQACFPPEQLLVMQYEACVADPMAQLRRTYAYLGLEADVEPAGLRLEVNKTRETKASLPPDAYDRLQGVLAPDIAELAALLPDLDLSLWPSAAGIA